MLATHSPEVCPQSNAKTRALLTEMGPKIPSIAQAAGVNILAGPLVNNEHITVTILESDDAQKVVQFVAESRLGQWNTVRIIPSQTVQEGMSQMGDHPTLF
jgi:hypothetical protein